MKENTLLYPSHEKGTQIRALLWEPSNDQPPKAIFQIIHGAAEHIERYRDFAEFLTNAGYVVCGADHIGHGKSVGLSGQLGHMPLKGGQKILLNDTHSLYKKMKEFYPNLPYVMLGHSMGSFVLREYITQYSNDLSCAIVCGTGQQNLALSLGGNALATVLSLFRGSKHRSKFLHNMGLGAYAKQLRNPRTPLDWLSTDPLEVNTYISDRKCGVLFSTGAYVTLTKLTASTIRVSQAIKIRADLPLLFISGEDDPVGNNGKGVRKAVEQYKKAGMLETTLYLYEGMRHEVLNETNKKRVFSDIVYWTNKKVQ